MGALGSFFFLLSSLIFLSSSPSPPSRYPLTVKAPSPSLSVCASTNNGMTRARERERDWFLAHWGYDAAAVAAAAAAVAAVAAKES